LDPEWQWWQWHKNSRRGYIAWTQFVADLYEYFDIDTHHLGCLTKLKQSGTVEEYITAFEQLDFQMDDISSTPSSMNALLVALRMTYEPMS
jgi:hypothetical protein